MKEKLVDYFSNISCVSTGNRRKLFTLKHSMSQTVHASSRKTLHQKNKTANKQQSYLYEILIKYSFAHREITRCFT